MATLGSCKGNYFSAYFTIFGQFLKPVGFKFSGEIAKIFAQWGLICLPWLH